MLSFILSLLASRASATVVATGPNGPTNPAAPKLNTPINQSSNARLLSVNSIDDFCIFGPQTPGSEIGDTEEEQVAWCVKDRNNARLIPNGVFTSVQFTKAPSYIQINALGDFTKIGVKKGDSGGELDPLGAYGYGNPKGGNVTSDFSGQTIFYQNWMEFISDSEVCIRVCTAEPRWPAEETCAHVYDLMGCNWVEPHKPNKPGVFETCDADDALPPGRYPRADGSTSTFSQYWTGIYTYQHTVYSYTNGAKGQTTPSAAYSTPASSNCRTQSTFGAIVTSATGSASVFATTTSSSSSATTSGSASSRSTSASVSQTQSASSSSSSSSSSGSSSASNLSSVSSGTIVPTATPTGGSLTVSVPTTLTTAAVITTAITGSVSGSSDDDLDCMCYA